MLKFKQMLRPNTYSYLYISYVAICSCIVTGSAHPYYFLVYRCRNPDYDRIDHDVDQLNDSQNPAFGKL